LSDLFIIDHMILSLTDMAPLQHSVLVGTGLLSIKGLDLQSLCLVFDLGSLDTLDSLDAQTPDLFNIQLSFASHTDDIGFISVYPVLFQKLLKAVCITWL